MVGPTSFEFWVVTHLVSASFRVLQNLTNLYIQEDLALCAGVTVGSQSPSSHSRREWLSCYKSRMRKWMRDRMKRRTKSGKPNEAAGTDQEQKTGPAPLQPTFLDRDSGYHSEDEASGRDEAKEERSH